MRLALCLTLVSCTVLLSVGSLIRPSRGGIPLTRSRLNVVAELENGPTEYMREQQLQHQHERKYGDIRRDATPLFTPEERAAHMVASQAARKYASLYVPIDSDQLQHHAPPKQHGTSGYDILARQQEQARLKAHHQRMASQKQRKAKMQAKSDSSAADGSFDFADAGAFVEEGVKMSDPFPKQEWTYADTDSPPEWLVPDAEAKQGCPTTKPPPVPRMPPPPPPTPTPTWMSPFDEHNTPVYPQSSTPAPYYGMGPVPPGPPANYLPLDTFMSPAPEGGR